MIYRHYKGGLYQVLGEATHTENQESLVIYKDSNGKIWARPKDDFYGNVKVSGTLIKRFKLEEKTCR